MRATNVNAGLAESNCKLLLGIWRDSLHVTCGLTACTPGSASGPTLGNEYGKTLPFLPAHLGSSGIGPLNGYDDDDDVTCIKNSVVVKTFLISRNQDLDPVTHRRIQPIMLGGAILG